MLQLFLFREFSEIAVEPRTVASPFRSPRPPPRFRTTATSPSLEALWKKIRTEYFPTHPGLTEYKICWSSRRQKRTLASCNILRKRVVVARELERVEYSAYLEAVVYHEMCHAVLGYERTPGSRKRTWHGATFKRLEAQHPGIAPLNRWIRSGGWSQAVRRDRATRASRARWK